MSKSIVDVLPVGFRKYLSIINIDGVEEIRLRADKNAILYFGGNEGELVTDYIVSLDDIKETLSYISMFSLYAYEDDIKEGFITIKGGHRVGLAGKIVRENGRIKTIGNISSINIRVSHEVKGCSRCVLPSITEDNKIFNTLIISPPGAGKTTLLRDVVRELSDTYKRKVSLVDERSEIAACYMGVPQNDVGIRTDVYDDCKKTEGLMLMIRAMSPQVVAVDEIGGLDDINSLIDASRCGCNIVATIHGDSIEDVMGKSFMSILDKDRLFSRFIVLSNDSARRISVYDENGAVLTER
ncbi:MAG: stage III sporulation protein AA [Lachnospiraceae bacterium]|nr:stage III sporulation protein AA [Lachnospiraceae bacterium]